MNDIGLVATVYGATLLFLLTGTIYMWRRRRQLRKEGIDADRELEKAVDEFISQREAQRAERRRGRPC